MKEYIRHLEENLTTDKEVKNDLKEINKIVFGKNKNLFDKKDKIIQKNIEIMECYLNYEDNEETLNSIIKQVKNIAIKDKIFKPMYKSLKNIKNHISENTDKAKLYIKALENSVNFLEKKQREFSKIKLYARNSQINKTNSFFKEDIFKIPDINIKNKNSMKEIIDGPIKK